MKKKVGRTVDEEIRDRLYEEFNLRRDLKVEEEVVDEVIDNTAIRLEEYVKVLSDQIKLISTELSTQQAAIGHRGELRIRQEELSHHSNETATLGVNLADVFFRSDVNLFEKHVNLAEDDVIILALTHDPELFNRLKDLMTRIETINEGLSGGAK